MNKITRRQALKSLFRGAAIGLAYGILDTPDSEPKLKNALEQKIETEKQTKPTAKQEPEVKNTRKIPIFESEFYGDKIIYNNPKLHAYDNLIIKYCDFWNNEFSQQENFKKIQPDLVKKILLIETASQGNPVDEFYTDPMQIGKDFGWKLAKNGGDTFYPENGYEDKQELTPELSIKYGTRLLIEKAITSHKFVSEPYSDEKIICKLKSGDNPSKLAEQFRTTAVSIIKENNIKNPTKLQIGQELTIPLHKLVPKIINMDYTNAASGYNGGGDEHYQDKFDAFKETK